MRTSVFKDDPGYQNFVNGITQRVVCVVTLDGVPQPLVQTADEEEGFILRNILTDPSDPRSYKVDYKKGEFCLERVEGNVKIEFVIEGSPQDVALRESANGTAVAR